MVTAIVGANWGDEGKGKITDLLARPLTPSACGNDCPQCIVHVRFFKPSERY